MTAAPVLDIRGATAAAGGKELWRDLTLSVQRGEFLAVLGPSGSGKTTLLRTILGLRNLAAGTIRVDGLAPRRARTSVGYVPQQRPFLPGTSMRARDLVALGVSGTRFGFPIPHRGDRQRVDDLLDAVGATSYADHAVGTLSGGEQQRLRVGQALADDPSLLLCDEPLSSLDLANQRAVTSIIDARRRERGTAVVFVTHDVNPVLDRVDRILYFAGGRFTIGTPDEVLHTAVLSEMYGTAVEVLRTEGRVVVLGIPDADPHHPHHLHDHEHADEVDP